MDVIIIYQRSSSNTLTLYNSTNVYGGDVFCWKIVMRRSTAHTSLGQARQHHKCFNRVWLLQHRRWLGIRLGGLCAWVLSHHARRLLKIGFGLFAVYLLNALLTEWRAMLSFAIHSFVCAP